jgi:hypothetical protein
MSVSVLEQLKAKKEAISADLSKVEQSIYDLEGAYLAAECTQCGSVLKVNGQPHSRDGTPSPPCSVLH